MSQLDDAEQPDKYDEDVIQSTIGNFGRWQFKISILMALLKFPIAWFHMSIVFLAPPTQFWCQNPALANATLEWTRMVEQNGPYLKHEGLNSGFCQTMDETTSTFSNCPNGYNYNTTIFHSSIITEWNLVCDKKRLVDISQVVLMLGVLIGNVAFGVLADRQGRKKTLLICIVLQSLFGIAAARMPWYWGFVAARFFLAVANGGPWRSIVPILYQIPYGFGNSIMAGLAYMFRTWRDLHLVLSLLSSFYIAYLWFVPESPRWLLAVGRKDEAVEILENAAKLNGVDSVKIKLATSTLTETKEANTSLKGVLLADELVKRNVLLCVNWFIAGATFYAFSQYVGKVGSNLYFTAAISGFVALPGTLLCVYIVRRFGRRLTIAAAHVLTAICFFGILATPSGVFPQDWPRIVIAGVGIVGLSVSMPALYLFTGELFPTTVRNAGVGASLMVSRLGSMVAPLIIAMQDISPILPLAVLGSAALVETFLILLLPETKGMPLLETMQDLRVKPQEVEEVNTVTRKYISLPMIKDESLK